MGKHTAQEYFIVQFIKSVYADTIHTMSFRPKEGINEKAQNVNTDLHKVFWNKESLYYRKNLTSTVIT